MVIFHYKQHIPQLFKEHLKNKSIDEKTKILTKWKDMLTSMHFTTTSFQKDADAIFYFGKLNDAETKLQLNVGDLLGHTIHRVVQTMPASEHDTVIKKAWTDIQDNLKNEKSKDMIPDFLDGWLIAQGNKTNKRQIYKILKDDIKRFKEGGRYDKAGVKKWLNDIKNASSWYKQIVFPDDGGKYSLRMDVMERIGKQHRGLFLAGFLGFEKHNDSPSMKRLMNIWEFLKMKGEQIPNICSDNEKNINGVASNNVYYLVEEWCKLIYDAGDQYTKKIIPSKAKQILDRMETDVVSLCTNVWSAAEDIEWNSTKIGNLFSKIKINQNRAKMILTRLEINKSGGDKYWDIQTDVEHIAPQKFSRDWVDIEKGGGFKNENEYKEQWIQNLGNRTLLNPGSNKKLLNHGFKFKQTLENHGYNAQASEWKVTEELGLAAKWGPGEIEKRSKNLVIDLIDIYDDGFTS